MALASIPSGQRTISPIAIYAPRIESGKLDETAAWDLDSTG